MTTLARRLTLALCLAALSLPALADAFADAEISTSGPALRLELRYVPGTTYLQTMTMDQTATIPMGGPGAEQKTKSTMSATMNALKSTGDGLRLALTYDRVETETSAMGQTTRYDSDDESTHDSPLAMMGVMVGPTLTLTLDGDSQVTKVDGMDELLANIGDENQQARQMATQMLGKEQISRLTDLGVAQLMPENEVKPGDAWDSTFTTPGGPLGEMAFTTTNTFVGYAACGKQRCAVIDTQGTIELEKKDGDDDDPAAEAMRAMGLEIDSATTTSRIFFDPKLGMLREGRTVVEMEMSMQVPGQEERASMSLKQTATVSIETK